MASGAPDAARRFVLRTFALVEGGDLCEVASAFAFGREDLLPDLFRRVVAALDAQTGKVRWQMGSDQQVTGTAVKLTALRFAPLMVTAWLAGLNV